AERGSGCLDLAACMQNETHALRRCEAAHRFFKRQIDFARIVDNLEKRSRGFEALQLALAQHKSVLCPAEGFDQPDRLLNLAEEAQLQQRLVIFALEFRIRDDAAADADLAAPVRTDHRSADRDIEREIAAWRRIAD